MNIVIVGLGKFGIELTEHLSKENHNIIVIDTKQSIIVDIVGQFDVKGYCGNGASYLTQKEAFDGKDTDLLIATTSTDEANILCCLVAKKLGVNQTIARVRNPEYALQAQLMHNELGISMTLNPDLDTAIEIFRILRYPSALQVESFANGKVDLVEIKIDANSLLKDTSLVKIKDKYKVKILICAVKRNEEVIIPNGDFTLKEGDYVYVTADSKELATAFKKLKLVQSRLSSTIIIGGGKITYYLASMLLENNISVKIIEKDKNICKALSELLPKALIINGEGTNQKLLLSEGISDVDSTVSLTGMDETNIVISSFANTLNLKKVVTKVSNSNYDLILKNVGLDIVVSPKEIFSSHIIRYVRGMANTLDSEFKTLYRLVGNKVEALEFVISKATSYTSIPLKDLHIKKNYLLACIIRENQVIIPSGKDTLEPLDSVVIVTTNTSLMDVSEILE